MSKTKAIDKNSEEYFEKHMHDGHRQRLLSTVFEGGLEKLSDIQILEFALFYIFPRGDVNPLAHRLLAKFKTFHGVLDASIQDLADVRGMGMTSAKKLSALMSIFEYYTFDKMNNSCTIDNFDKLLVCIEKLLRYQTQEKCYMFGIGQNGRIGYGRLFGRGDISSVQFAVADLATYLSTYKIKFVIFAHNHPKGNCFPSVQDNATAERLNSFLGLFGVQLYDSLIVGEDGIYSCIGKGVRRHFIESDKRECILEPNQQMLIDTLQE